METKICAFKVIIITFMKKKKKKENKLLISCFSEDILYIFEDPNQVLPCESIPLKFGRCKKVRKICCDRPHTIEISLINYSIILAPANCSQEEKWFNALSYAMVGVS